MYIGLFTTICIIVASWFVCNEYQKSNNLPNPQLTLGECEQAALKFEKKYKDTWKIKTLKVKVTAYCPCKECNKQWAGLVCNGKKMSYYTDKGINICAVDPTLIPLGSTLMYNGVEYYAIDVGSAIKGNIIDILKPTHDEANAFGVKHDQIICIKK